MKKIIFALIILTLSLNLYALTKNEKAFIEAAKNGDIETVRYLINSEVDIDVQDNDGNTALIMASQNGYFDIVKLLVDNGAYIEIKNNSGCTAIDCSRTTEILTFFMKIDPFYTFNNREILIYQSQYGNKESVKILLDEGIDINIRNQNGNTPFMTASFWKNTDIMKLLLEYGANVNDQDNIGKTALMYSVSSIEVTKILLEAGADVNMQNNYGYTALMYSYSKEITKILLEAGADINMQNNYGYTALMQASYYGNTHFDAVEILLQYGADTTIRNNDGETAMDIAKKQKNYEIIGLLESYK